MHSNALVIFDIDGTLLRAELVTVPALEQTFREFGIPAPDTGVIYSLFGAPVEEYEAWLAAHAPGREKAFVEAANRRELELIGASGRLYDGVEAMLVALTRRGHVLATCSNGSVAYVNEALDAHGLRPYFRIVRCIGQGFDGKPAMVRDILDAVALRPAVVVGDRRSDVEAAHANGLLAIGATYGFGGRDELAEADALIHSVAELPGVLDRIVEERC